MEEIEALKRRLERERSARKQAESIAEQKTREIYLANQELVKLTSHLEDLVQARTAEANNARDEAVRASQAKSQFLANMSHELRTPLNAIIGYSEMLEEEAQEGGMADFIPDLRKIHGAGKHLLGLINDILDISKIEAGKMELYLESFELAPVLREIAGTVRPMLEANGNALVLEGLEEAGTMHSDLTKIRQILINLLSNAIKFTRHGWVTLKVARDDEWVKFSVTDTGIGMTPEEVDRLFQPFTQADASTTRKYGGTGLGLAISNRFGAALDGSISVQSTPGTGSTFTLMLPCRPLPLAMPSDVAQALPSAGGCGTVLVIDDDDAARELMQRFLTGKGFRVETASNGPDGLRKAAELMPAAITLDVMMPGMDGWTVLAALKQDAKLATIPVVMLTIVDEKSLGFALGAADYLTKPIDRKRLDEVLDRYRIGPDNGVVLMVEDDAPTRKMTRHSLQKSGLNVVEAHNGEEALERLATLTPQLILLDLMMPVMDGFQFLAQLRQNPAWRSIPVVILTAKELDAHDRALLNGNVERILQKGALGRDALLAEVHALLVPLACP
jgi:signal transduction histidine kinase/CheY-like chemotaxis protein